LEVTLEQIKALRDLTGAGIMDCKRALQAANGDPERAEAILQEQGVSSARKKASRVTNEGLVEAYIHSGGRIGSIVEVNCETDFVARTPDLKLLAHDIAMQVAAMSPLYVDTGDIPESEDHVPQEACLLQQPFIKNPAQTVQDLMNEAVARLGENVRVRRFSRFSVGE
jgi:elongation factor Ts